MAETEALPYEDVIKKREYLILNNVNDYITNQNDLDSEDKLYGLPIFWELIQDKAP